MYSYAGGAGSANGRYGARQSREESKSLDRDLREASERGETETVRALVQEGANVNSVNWVRRIAAANVSRLSACTAQAHNAAKSSHLLRCLPHECHVSP
eukprot:SAG11_NODE_3527_length_2392_cov_1.501962_1_plen_99_part_00